MDTLLNNKAVMIGLAVLAFLVAAVLVLTIVRMLFGGRLRMPGGRARQARLGIVDAFDLDRQRQLIIVRRDNTEHLIMIGGPNDIVIESEIVRVEARDPRDGRREKVADTLFAPSFGEARIPAPAPVEREAPAFASAPFASAPVRENPARDVPVNEAPPPLSPMLPELDTPPEDVPPQAAAAPPRAPTFPLPPRRPPGPAPERRPAPPPLRLPEGVSRTDDIPPPPNPSAGAAPLPPLAAVPPVNPAVQAPSGVPTPAAPRPAPPFLKPRPPIRPLLRTTPQPTRPLPGGAPAAPAPPAADPQVAAPGAPPFAPPDVAPPQAPPQAVAPPAKAPPAPAVLPPATPVESKDALESLEEEMAKLLGRGPGA